MARERRLNDQADHDTIIRVETKLDIALGEIKKLNEALTDGLAKKLDAADFATFKETTLKTVVETQADHETRIRRFEVWGWMAIGALALLEVIMKFFQ